MSFRLAHGVGKPAKAHDRFGHIVIPLIAVLLVSGKLLFNSSGVLGAEIMGIESLNEDIHVVALGSQLLEWVRASRLFWGENWLKFRRPSELPAMGRNQNRGNAVYFHKRVTDATSV